MAQQDSSGERGSQPPAADRAEVQRLRAEVARLRARQTGRAGRTGRWVAAAALLLVAVLLGIASIVAVFARNQLLDTDRYVATVAPLARDPVVQDAVANRLTSEIITRTDVDALARQVADYLKKQGAPAEIDVLVSPAVNGVESFVYSAVRKIVDSRYFAQAWDSANRVAHASLVKILTGAGDAPVSSTETTVYIDLGAVLEQVKQQLVDAGFGIAARIPSVAIQYPVYESSDLPKIRNYVRWLERAAAWLPLVALTLLIAGIAVAPNHRRGLLTGGLFIAVGLLLARGAFAVLRTYYLDHLPPSSRRPWPSTSSTPCCATPGARSTVGAAGPADGRRRLAGRTRPRRRRPTPGRQPDPGRLRGRRGPRRHVDAAGSPGGRCDPPARAGGDPCAGRLSVVPGTEHSDRAAARGRGARGLRDNRDPRPDPSRPAPAPG